MFAETLKIFQHTRLYPENLRSTSVPAHWLHFTGHGLYLCFELPQALINNSHPLQITHLYVINFMKDTSHERIYIIDKGCMHKHTHTHTHTIINSESRNSIKRRNYSSKFSQQIVENNHWFRNIEDIIKIVFEEKKGRNIDTVQRL